MNARRFDPIRAIEACYAGPSDDRAWLAGLASAFEPLAFDRGIAAMLWEVRDGRAACAAHAVLGPAPIGVADTLEIWSTTPPHVVEAWFSGLSAVDTARARLQKLALPDFAAPLEAFSARGIADGLGVTARAPAGRHVHVWLMSSQRVRVGPRAQHRLARVAAHLATAARLRAMTLAGGEAAAHAASGSLASAVYRSERARGRLRQVDPDEAVELWRGLVEGGWSLVDHVESGGSRVVLARRNPPGAPDPKALSRREREVLAHVVQGHSNKHVAYVLGLSAATVASHLKGALSKLGVRSRGEAIGLLSGTGAPARARPPGPRDADPPDGGEHP